MTEPTIHNWKEYIATRRCLIGFIKGTELLAVSPAKSGLDSKQRIDLAPEGIDFDYIVLLHTYFSEHNYISGHTKEFKHMPGFSEHWKKFNPDTFEIIKQ